MTRGYDHLIGRTLGKLYVESKEVKNKRTYLWCVCTCGRRSSILGWHVKAGHNRSCGCRSAKVTGKMNPTYTGHEDISGVYWGKVQEGAQSRNLPFEITIQEAWALFEKQQRKCALSGVALKFNTGCYIRDGNASLDRIDSEKGYINGNIQWVHKTVNKIKGKFKDSELIAWCELITEHSGVHRNHD